MTIQSPATIARRRRSPWLWLGGCALAAFMLLCLCLAIDALRYAPAALQAARASGTDVSVPALDTLPAGDASHGQQVFQGDAGCSACHSLEPGRQIVGPSLAGIASRAPTRKPDTSADAYIYESITHPNAYVVEGFQPDIMPNNFASRLTPQDLADLIAFLMTQQ